MAAVLDQELQSAAPGEPHEEWPFADRVASIGEHVLSSVQDAVAEATTEPWPRLPSGDMANASSRTDGERVYLWYGPRSDREDGAVLTLAPIALKELVNPNTDPP